MEQRHLEDEARLPRDGSVTLLDVRTVNEYAGGHMEGFQNIPVDELRERLDEIDSGKPSVVISRNRFAAYNFAGGFRFYDAVINDRCLIEAATECGMDKADPPDLKAAASSGSFRA